MPLLAPTAAAAAARVRACTSVYEYQSGAGRLHISPPPAICPGPQTEKTPPDAYRGGVKKKKLKRSRGAFEFEKRDYFPCIVQRFILAGWTANGFSSTPRPHLFPPVPVILSAHARLPSHISSPHRSKKKQHDTRTQKHRKKKSLKNKKKSTKQTHKNRKHIKQAHTITTTKKIPTTIFNLPSPNPRLPTATRESPRGAVRAV